LTICKVHCLRLARNDHIYGVLAIYLADDQHPTERERSLLDALAQEMSLALESQHLRGRELAMLSRLQQASRLSNLRRDLEREDTGIRSLLIAPLHTENQQLGNLVLWAVRPDLFTRRHAQLVAIVAGQGGIRRTARLFRRR